MGQQSESEAGKGAFELGFDLGTIGFEKEFLEAGRENDFAPLLEARHFAGEKGGNFSEWDDAQQRKAAGRSFGQTVAVEAPAGEREFVAGEGIGGRSWSQLEGTICEATDGNGGATDGGLDFEALFFTERDPGMAGERTEKGRDLRAGQGIDARDFIGDFLQQFQDAKIILVESETIGQVAQGRFPGDGGARGIAPSFEDDAEGILLQGFREIKREQNFHLDEGSTGRSIIDEPALGTRKLGRRRDGFRGDGGGFYCSGMEHRQTRCQRMRTDAAGLARFDTGAADFDLRGALGEGDAGFVNFFIATDLCADDIPCPGGVGDLAALEKAAGFLQGGPAAELDEKIGAELEDGHSDFRDVEGGDAEVRFCQCDGVESGLAEHFREFEAEAGKARMDWPRY